MEDWHYVLQGLRGQLYEGIVASGDVSEIINSLLSINCPLSARYSLLNMEDLIRNNSRFLEGLKKIGVALNILEKYCRHLLKPPSERSQMWRFVKFSNTIFHERVDNIKGGREIMKIMGYTENIPDGLAFPENAETDRIKLINLLADILCGKRELDAYLTSGHPNPEKVEEILPHETVLDVAKFQKDWIQQGNLPARSQIHQSYQPLQNIAISNTASDIRSANQRLSSSGSSESQSQQTTHENLTNHQHLRSASTEGVISQQNDLSKQSNEALPGKLSSPEQRTVQTAAVIEEVQESPESSIVCDICGMTTATYICGKCDNKQLCTACDKRWHQHPKRKNHDRQKIQVSSEQKSDDPEFISAVENHNPMLNPTLPQNALEVIVPVMTNALPTQDTPVGMNTPHYSTAGIDNVAAGHGVPHVSSFQQFYDRGGQEGFVSGISGFPQNQSVNLLPNTLPRQQSESHIQQNVYSTLPRTGSNNQESLQAMASLQKTAPGGPPSSKLLAKIMAIPDLNKRKAKIEIQLIALQEEIDTVEERIQEFIANSPTFFEDEEYSRLFRNKGLLQREKMELEKYEKELDNVLGQREQMVYPSQWPMSYQSQGGLSMPLPSSVGTPSMNHTAGGMIVFVPNSNNLTGNHPVFVQSPSLSSGDIQGSGMHRMTMPSPPYYHSTMSIPGGQDQSIQCTSPNNRLGYQRQHALPHGHHDQHLAYLNQLPHGPHNHQALPQGIQQTSPQGPHNTQVSRLPNTNQDKQTAPQQCHFSQGQQGSPQGHEHFMYSNQMTPRQPHNSPLTPIGFEPAAQAFIQHKREFSHPNFTTGTRFSANQGFHKTDERRMYEENVANESHQRRLSTGGPLNQRQLNTGSPMSNRQLQTGSPDNRQTTSSPSGNRQFTVGSPSGNTQLSSSPNRASPLTPNARKPIQPQQFIPPPKFHDTPVNAKTVYQNYPPPPDLYQMVETPPVPIPPRVPIEPQPSRPRSDGYGLPWICQHCTFHNDADTRVCGMCFKTSDNPKLIEKDKHHKADSEIDNIPTLPTCAPQAKQESASGESEATKIMKVASSAGKKILQDYDEIYLEKQEAKRQFEEKMKREEKEKLSELQELQKSVQIPRALEKVEGKKQDVPACVEQSTSEASKAEITKTASSNKPTDTVKSPKNKQGLTFSETMEFLQRKREQDLMAIEARELVNFFKEAEKEGFDTDEAEIAVQVSLTDKLIPMAWLKQVWLQRVKNVVTKTIKAGQDMGENEIGELSASEAKAALKETKGEVTTAVQKCKEKRCKLYKEIVSSGTFPREEILRAMLVAEGKLEDALDHLNSSHLQQYIDHLWENEDSPRHSEEEINLEEVQNRTQEVSMLHDPCISVTNSVLSHKEFQRLVRSKDMSLDRRARMIMVEGKLQSWGRAEVVLRILDNDVATNGLDATLEEIVEAVRNCGDRQSSLVYLQQECQVCFAYFPMSKIRTLNCPCKICVECMTCYFELNIREKHVRNLCCPICQHPDMDNTEAANEYLTFLTMLLSTMVGPEIREIYEVKLRDWHLQKDPNFRWCAHCGGGFINAGGDRNPAMQCPYCRKKTCFNCKKQWEDQHEGLTCEEYEQWKIDNDPENQALGLAAHLATNGIDCPSCKMRFSLAKGGCMHFNCPECGHEFCSGCSQIFDSKGVCTKFRSCRGKGLHCHHPRDCFYYLRDNTVEELQKLLAEKRVKFDTATPETQENPNNCPVMELKDVHEGKKDEACGKAIQDGHAGLCCMHYKEYLVNLINKNKLDPVHIMNIDEIIRLIEREEKTPPQRKPNHQDSQYRKKLMQFVKEKIPLLR